MNSTSPPTSIRNVKASEVMRTWRVLFTYKWNGDQRSDETEVTAPDEEVARQKFLAVHPNWVLTMVTETTTVKELEGEQERTRKILELERTHAEATKVRTTEEEIAFQKTREARAIADAAERAAKHQAETAEKVAQCQLEALSNESYAKANAIRIEADAKVAVITAAATADRQAEVESKARTAAYKAKQRMYTVFTVAGPVILTAIGAFIGM